MTVLLCDVDGVLADFTGAVLGILREEFGHEFTRDQVTQWSFRDSLDLTPYEWRTVSAQISEAGFAERLEPTPAVSELKRILERGAITVQFVTSPWRGSPTWCYDRTEWLQKQFGRSQGGRVTFTAEKYQVAGDLFVDDHPLLVEAWMRAQVGRGYPEPWQGYLWEAPHNLDAEVGVRVRSFEHVLGDFREW